MESKNKASVASWYRKPVARWLLAFFFIGLALWLLFDNKNDLKQLSQINTWQFGLLLFIHLTYLIISSLQFLIILYQQGLTNIPPFSWFKVFVVGRFLNKFAAQAGNIYRSVYLKQVYDFSYTKYASSFAAAFWLEMILALTMATLVISLLEPTLKLGAINALALLGTILTGLAAGPFIIKWLVESLNLSGKRIEKIHGKINELLQLTTNVIRQPKVLFFSFLLGILSFLMSSGQLYTAFQIIGVDLSLSKIMIYVILLKLSLIINVTPGNLGIRELVYGQLSQMLGVGVETGILVSSIIRLVTYVLLGLLGILFGGLPLLRPQHNK